MARAFTTLGAMILLALVVSSPTLAQTGLDEITIEHGVSAVSALPGDEVVFTVVLTTESDEPLTGIDVKVVAHELIADLSLIGTGAVRGSLDDGGRGISWSDVVVGAVQPVTLRYEGTIVSKIDRGTEAIVNRATVTVGQATGDEDSDQLAVQRVADSIVPTLQKTDSSRFVGPGEQVEYRLEVENGAATDAAAVVVRVRPNLLLSFDQVDDTADYAIENGELVWAIGDLPAGESQDLTYPLTAVDQFPADPDIDDVEVLVEANGSTAASDHAVLTLVASDGELDVRHRPNLDGEEFIWPGDVIEYVIEITNNSSVAPFEDLEITVTPDSAVFGSITALNLGTGDEEGGDPGSIGQADNTLRWSVQRVGPGSTVVLRYEVAARGRFIDQPRVKNTATVEVGGATKSTPTNEVALATARDALDVVHTSTTGEEIQPGGTVQLSVNLLNFDLVADIEDIEVEVVLDENVFASARRTGVGPGQASALSWSIPQLGPGDEQTVTYEATARPSFPDGVDTATNQITISIGDESGQPLPNAALALRVDRSSGTTNEPPLEGALLFTLIMVFLLVSFVSVSFLVIGRRTGLDGGRQEIGLNLFATVSLVSATLILALGTSVGTEALSLLAAIAGYVLGRRFSSDGPAPAPVTAVQPDPGGGPTPSVGAAAVAGVPAPVGPVATGAYEWRLARQNNRLGLLALLAVALLSPVLIVLSTVWLLDSTNGGEISTGTYLSAGTVALLVLVFICFMFYLYSEASGEGAVRALLGDNGTNDGDTGDGGQAGGGGAAEAGDPVDDGPAFDPSDTPADDDE